jgi:P-type Cu+ transporter
MHENATEPVIIFLPVEKPEGTGELVIDPVCGRALSGRSSAGRLLHNGRNHHFCSLRCAERFAADPSEFGSS